MSMISTPLTVLALKMIGEKLFKFGTDIFIDEPTKAQIKRVRNRGVDYLQRNFSRKTITNSATNHDLERAFTLAVCKASDMWLATIQAYCEIPIVKDDERDVLEGFADRVIPKIDESRRLARNRLVDFNDPFGLTEMVDRVLKVNHVSSTDQTHTLSRALADSFRQFIVAVDGPELPPYADSVLKRTEKPLDGVSDTIFGQWIMDEFIEILKSGKYPEATNAFDQTMFASLHDEITSIKADFADNQSETSQHLLNLIEYSEDHLDKLQAIHFQIQERYDEQTPLLKRIDERQRRQFALRLSTLPPVVESDTDFSYYSMTFEARKTEFVGRDLELAQLKLFLADDKPVCWWQIAGDGGQGKSRLALQLIDEIGPEWHAGFISEKDLGKTNWDAIDIEKNTLCIIDYIAAPSKISAFGHALESMHRRAEETEDLTSVKMRFLVLERSPFSFVKNSESALLTWIDQLTGKTKTEAILKSTVFSVAEKTYPVALHLGDLKQRTLIDICNSWRFSQSMPTLTETQKQVLVGLLLGTNNKVNKANRPLLAMLCATAIDGDTAVKFEEQSILDILRRAFEDERNTYWRSDNDGKADGEKITPAQESVNVACLTTMIGRLDYEANLPELIPDNMTDSDPFYQLTPETAEQAWMVLGQRRSINNDVVGLSLPHFTARQPDLLGEFMVIWALESSVTTRPLQPANPYRAEKLISDAWQLDADTTLAFLIRMREDFRTHAVTEKLTGVRVPINIARAYSDRSALLAFYGLTGLMSAAYDDSRESTNKANIDFELLLASQEGHSEVVAMLLEKDAAVNKDNERDGLFPLLQASQNGHSEVVAMLLEKDAAVNKDNEQNGNFPLLMASHDGHSEVVAMLLEKDAAVNKDNEQSGNFPLLQASQNGHSEVVAMLLEKDAAVNKEDEQSGNFPLLQAALNGHSEVVAMLLEKDAAVNKENDQNGTFPLLMASRNGHSEVVAMLLENGAEIDKINHKSGIFCLLGAVVFDRIETTALLLEKGANPLQQTDIMGGRSVLQVAIDEQHNEIAELLQGYVRE